MILMYSNIRMIVLKAAPSLVLSMRPSIGPWVSPGYLRLTDSLPVRVERAVATNHAEKAGLSLLWETLGIFLCRG